MSTRVVGGKPAWGTAHWGVDTWAVTAAQSTLITRLLETPSTVAGVSLGPSAPRSGRFVVEMLAPDDTSGAHWGVAHWGTDHWSGGLGDWVDVTTRLRGLHWETNVRQPGQRSEVGTAALTLNNLDGLVSPWATSGAFTVSGTSFMRAGLIIRWGVIFSDGEYLPDFTGIVEQVAEDTDDHADAWVNLTLVETTRDLAVVPPLQAFVGGRTLSEAIWLVLNNADWPYQQQVTVPNEDALLVNAQQVDNSAAERLGLLCDAMHWDYCADGRGQVVCFRRHLTDYAPQATLANKPSATSGSVAMASAKPYSNADRVLNQVTAANTQGTEVVLDDSTSEGEFGVISIGYGFPRNDLPVDSTQLHTLATRVLALRAWDDRGIASVSLDADMDPANLFDLVPRIASLARDQRAYQVVWTHPTSGAVLNEQVVIEGQTHDVTYAGRQFKWTCTLATGHSGPLAG